MTQGLCGCGATGHLIRGRTKAILWEPEFNRTNIVLSKDDKMTSKYHTAPCIVKYVLSNSNSTDTGQWGNLMSIQNLVRKPSPLQFDYVTGAHLSYTHFPSYKLALWLMSTQSHGAKYQLVSQEVRTSEPPRPRTWRSNIRPIAQRQGLSAMEALKTLAKEIAEHIDPEHEEYEGEDEPPGDRGRLAEMRFCIYIFPPPPQLAGQHGIMTKLEDCHRLKQSVFRLRNRCNDCVFIAAALSKAHATTGAYNTLKN